MEYFSQDSSLTKLQTTLHLKYIKVHTATRRTMRHGLMLLWFTDLMNVTEEVIIHRPNVSTYLPLLHAWKSVIKTCKKNSTLQKAGTRYPISDRTFTAKKRRNTTHLRFIWKFGMKMNLWLAIACAFWESLTEALIGAM